MSSTERGLNMILFLILAGFLAALIDSVVGGGGLISLPALLMNRLPISVALGTNKMASTLSSLTSTLSFIRAGKVNLQLVKYLIPLSLIGSILGSYTVHWIPSQWLRPLMIVLLLGVTVYTIVKKDWGQISTYKGMTRKSIWLTAISAFAIGFYDGFFGPGTGSFLIFTFLMNGFDFVTAAGNAKVLNFTSNVGSLVTFMLLDSVNYFYGILMGGAMIVGAIVGSRVAIHKGALLIRPLFIGVTALLIGKQVWDALH